MQEWPTPLLGKSEGLPVDKEAPNSSGFLNNVFPKDVLEGRMRLGKRPGLDKWSATQIGGATIPVVCMCIVSTVA